jgi:hypothetical protein
VKHKVGLLNLVDELGNISKSLRDDWRLPKRVLSL